MTKFKVDIRDFLRTGNFGPIQLGMTRSQVELLLGKPESWGGQYPEHSREQFEQYASYNDYPIWEYDAMEFHFGDDRKLLYLIHCDHLDQLQSNGNTFTLDRWVFEANPPTREQVELALKEEKINYSDKRPDWFGTLVLSSGVEISYEYDDTFSVTSVDFHDFSYW